MKTIKNKKGSYGFILGVVAIFVLAFLGVVFGMPNNDLNGNDSILSIEEIEALLNSYFEDLNFTTNYYNTYINETYLNKTYIDNNYYETNEYTTNLYQTFNEYYNNYVLGLKPIDLNNDILNISNCSKIELQFYNTFENAIFDNNLKLSSKIKTYDNINIENSFFVSNDNFIIENNLFLYYTDIDTKLKALKIDNKNDFNAEFINSLSEGQLILNIAFEDWNNNKKEIFLNVYEDNKKHLEIYKRSNYIGIRNLISGEEFEIAKPSCYGNKVFCEYTLNFNKDEITLEIDGSPYIYLKNTFSEGDKNIKLSSSSYDINNKIYYRSIFYNSDHLTETPSEFTLNNETFTYDMNALNFLRIDLTPDYIYYTINGEFNSVENNLQNLSDYFLTLDLTKTSVAGAYCNPLGY